MTTALKPVASREYLEWYANLSLHMEAAVVPFLKGCESAVWIGDTRCRNRRCGELLPNVYFAVGAVVLQEGMWITFSRKSLDVQCPSCGQKNRIHAPSR